MALLSHFLLEFRIIINPRLIIEIHDDPDSKKLYFVNRIGRNKIFKSSLNPKKLFLVLLILLLPISASAGLMSALSTLFFGDLGEENLLSNKNIQNMALLVAATSPLGNGQIFGAPTTEGNALVSNVGPSGTVIDTLVHKPTSDQISVYVVRQGDTLSQIAEMFDVSVNTIKWGNDLRSNTLKVGETLVILPISGVKHTVAKGDTIVSLAKKYKGDADEIIAYNNLQKGESLETGSVIIIPDGEVLVPASIIKPISPSGLKEYAGYYMRPIAGGRKTQGIHGYNGIDLAAPMGTPIFATADGEVIIARTNGWNGGYGKYIVIRHNNGTQSLYAHTNIINVSAGDIVKQGDIIGTVGNSGKSTGPHVHFEIRGAKNPF
ncbi:MAG: peptidoglycan DD-metalloendopeptidase family protein [Patescibacteria group bacterium]